MQGKKQPMMPESSEVGAPQKIATDATCKSSISWIFQNRLIKKRKEEKEKS
jgi:hypothetical protein